MNKNNKNTHLTFEERKIIENGIINGSSKKAISDVLGKDNSTIGKEIKNHRTLFRKCSYPTNCENFAKCDNKKHCKPDSCPKYNPFKCNRRDRTPGACNGCERIAYCRQDKYKYIAKTAQEEYESELVNSRVGINLTPEELKKLAEVVVPLIKQGLSPYQIITAHPELGISEKTLYNYIEAGIFREFNLLDIDLREKVRRKMPSSAKTKYKKREDRSFLKGRTYKDFQNYTDVNSNANIVEMDTVYNDVSNGPFMQTFKFLHYGFTFIIYHNEKTSDEMVKGVDLLETILGEQLFKEEVEVLLTDRGGEFVNAEGFERDRRTRVYYCDPMRSSQKGSLENNHKEIRYICPKCTDLHQLGLTDQDAANLIVSHINSSPKEKLKGKSPIEMMKFMCLKLYEQFKKLGIEEIEKDKIILKPYLLKK